MEKIISVKDMIRYVLKKWRVICAFMILCAMCMEMYHAFTLYKVAHTTTTVSVATDNGRSNLTRAQVEETLRVYKAYMNYKEQMSDIEEYYENSLFMKYDSNDVMGLYIQYTVDCEKDKFALMNELNGLALDDEALAEMGAGIASDLVDEYISELVNRWVNGEASTDASNDAEQNLAKLCLGIFVTKEYNGEAIENAYLNFLNRMIDDNSEYFKDKYGKIEIKPYRNYTVTNVNGDVRAKQKTWSDYMTTISNSMTNLENALDDAQQVLFFGLVDGTYSIDLENDSDSVSDAEVTEVINQVHYRKRDYISIKKSIIGLIIGLILAVIILIVKFLFSAKLRGEKDIEYNFGLNLLGNTIVDARKSKGLDKAFKMIFKNHAAAVEMEKAVEDLLPEIVLYLKKNDSEKLMIVNSNATTTTNDIAYMLQKALKDKGIETVLWNRLEKDYDLAQIEKADSVILIEQVDYSLYDSIQKEVDICKACKLPVLGCVVCE